MRTWHLEKQRLVKWLVGFLFYVMRKGPSKKERNLDCNGGALKGKGREKAVKEKQNQTAEFGFIPGEKYNDTWKNKK